jgi:putative methionine-R-sulfoxide reductase with GAF domain
VRPHRDYSSLLSSLHPHAEREAAMQRAVDAMWELLGPRGVSWIGFYLKVPGREEMVLGPRRDKPACSPIGLHGMCGRSWREGRAIIVDDVATLGAGYIACDPRDRSELVIPLFDPDGACWGVLDADSYETASFGEDDVAALREAVERAGLSAPPPRPAPALRL